MNWTGPFGGGGIQLADEAALASLDPTFPYYLPKTSDSTKIFAPPKPDGSPGRYAIYFVLDDPKYGSVWVGESAPDLDTDAERQAFYRQSVAENGQSGISGTAEIVTIRDGITALLGTSNAGVSTISWVDGGAESFVLGPTLTRSQALEVANSI